VAPPLWLDLLAAIAVKLLSTWDGLCMHTILKKVVERVERSPATSAKDFAGNKAEYSAEDDAVVGPDPACTDGGAPSTGLDWLGNLCPVLITLGSRRS
jgi:hypothetical protein